MKRLALFFALFLFTHSIFAQFEEPDALTGEFVVQTFNAQSTDVTKFLLRPADFSTYCWNMTNPAYLSWTVYDPALYWVETSITGNLICDKPGFNVQDCYPSGGNNVFCSGIMFELKPLLQATYKVEIYVNGIFKNFFYYDTRTSKFPNNSIYNCDPCGNFQNDVTLRYNVGDNIIHFSKGVKTGSINTFDIGIVKEGESFNIWELNNCESYCVDGFSPRPFAVLYPPTPSGEVSPKPVLNWSTPEFPGETFVKYKVQRSINGGAFVTLAEITNINNRTYTDYEVNWNPDPNNTNFMQYRIATIYVNFGEQFPANSNIQKIFVGKWTQVSKGINRDLADSDDLNFLLNQNYPNPFNPETEISFYVSDKGFVNLKVLNIIGEEVSILVNEIKSEGLYSVKFNAGDLPSGIYFYTLSVNGFRETKKMILMR